jgi:Smg protein
MNEDVLDVLIYLFEHYSEEDVAAGGAPAEVKSELARAGFAESAVEKAFSWLDGLSDLDGTLPAVGCPRPALRVFAEREQQRLDVEARGFLLFLEQSGVLDPVRRELVIDRALALEGEEVDLRRLKWVVHMVLLNRPVPEGRWLEGLVFDQTAGFLH